MQFEKFSIIKDDLYRALENKQNSSKRYCASINCVMAEAAKRQHCEDVGVSGERIRLGRNNDKFLIPVEDRAYKEIIGLFDSGRYNELKNKLPVTLLMQQVNSYDELLEIKGFLKDDY